MQIVVYLNTLEREQGGGTHFHHPCMDGLTVQARLGLGRGRPQGCTICHAGACAGAWQGRRRTW